MVKCRFWKGARDTSLKEEISSSYRALGYRHYIYASPSVFQTLYIVATVHNQWFERKSETRHNRVCTLSLQVYLAMKMSINVYMLSRRNSA